MATETNNEMTAKSYGETVHLVKEMIMEIIDNDLRDSAMAHAKSKYPHAVGTAAMAYVDGAEFITLELTRRISARGLILPNR